MTCDASGKNCRDSAGNKVVVSCDKAGENCTVVPIPEVSPKNDSKICDIKGENCAEIPNIEVGDNFDEKCETELCKDLNYLKGSITFQLLYQKAVSYGVKIDYENHVNKSRFFIKKTKIQ